MCSFIPSSTNHSDRGVQYCSDAYIAELQKHGIAVSMTEDYNPTDNAVAERVNGIIKQETVNRRPAFREMEQATGVIGRYIAFYNSRRPHMSIGYKTPETVHKEAGLKNACGEVEKTLRVESMTQKRVTLQHLLSTASAEP